MNADDAKKIAEAGCKIVAEGANMPSDPEAIKVYHEKDIEFGPAKVPFVGNAQCPMFVFVRPPAAAATPSPVPHVGHGGRGC